ncbi:type-F conjugative transfer system protein TraW [Photobacterium piscicola]|uniref:type-F conjugative transfer system protein TraW n=1 Tax=Photobacterium piscicola TaxID=1378299 RepID=UPI0037364E67
MKRLVLLVALLSLPLHAKNLGVIAPTFPIAEIDMLDWIQQRLMTYEQTGEMDNMKTQFQEQVKKSVQRPPPVAGITTTTRPTTFTVDPTLTLASDINDEKGRVLFKKGLKINPFDASTWPNGQQLPHFTLSKQLVFLDGDDPQQLQWAKTYQAKVAKTLPTQTIKWILINGEPEKVFTVLHQRIYFDQRGDITRKLTVKHVPTVAKQVNTHWQLQEFDVSHEKDTPQPQ